MSALEIGRVERAPSTLWHVWGRDRAHAAGDVLFCAVLHPKALRRAGRPDTADGARAHVEAAGLTAVRHLAYDWDAQSQPCPYMQAAA